MDRIHLLYYRLIHMCILYMSKHFRMANTKFIASQAKSINLYKNMRSKLLKYCAIIYFNKQCLAKRVIPKYANIKFQNTSPVAQFTSKKAEIKRIKDEIKFLYKKKENLNRELYERHLKAAKPWGRMWYSIQNNINEKLNQNVEKKYKTPDLKINKLTHGQNKNLDTNTQFYPRVINKTDIEFSNEEMTLLNKGLKYNLTYKGKYWLSNLALEATAIITVLPTHEQEHV